MRVENISPAGPMRSGILAALKDASVKTGADFQYLLSTATRESGLNAEAKAKSSSASGLFQFIDQTWLGLVKQFGARHGLEHYASAIADEGNGRYGVASEETKSAILALRKDASFSALMAGEAANEVKKSLECTLGREVCGGEVYAAHFLGLGNARKLIALNREQPDCPAADEFPAAARANRSVFYNEDGSAKTAGQVYAWAMSRTEASKGAGSPSAMSLPVAPYASLGLRVLSQTPQLRPTDTSEPAFPQRSLQLSLGVLDVLAAMAPLGREERR